MSVRKSLTTHTSISLIDKNDQSVSVSMSDNENNNVKMAFHFLSQVSFDDYLELQQHLVSELADGADRMTVFLCEHADVLTVGRKGSHAHLRLSQLDRDRMDLQTHWLPRGGGCILHTPGQLAVYPLIPIQRYRFSPGRLLNQVRLAVSLALEQLGITPLCYPGLHSVWGRTGMLAAMGMSIQRGVSCFGSYINVNPDMRLFGYVDSAWHLPEDQTRRTMSSLMSENQTKIRMANVRSAVVQSLAEVFACDDYHMHTGHPFLTALALKRGKKKPGATIDRAKDVHNF